MPGHAGRTVPFSVVDGQIEIRLADLQPPRPVVWIVHRDDRWFVFCDVCITNSSHDDQVAAMCSARTHDCRSWADEDSIQIVTTTGEVIHDGRRDITERFRDPDARDALLDELSQGTRELMIAALDADQKGP